MLEILLRNRTPIATVLGLTVATLTFISLDARWYFGLPAAFGAMILVAVLWGIFLGLWEKRRGLLP